MPKTQLSDSYPLEFQELYAKIYNNKPQIQSVLKPFIINFISKCRKRLTLFFSFFVSAGCVTLRLAFATSKWLQITQNTLTK